MPTCIHSRTGVVTPGSVLQPAKFPMPLPLRASQPSPPKPLGGVPPDAEPAQASSTTCTPAPRATSAFGVTPVATTSAVQSRGLQHTSLETGSKLAQSEEINLGDPASSSKACTIPASFPFGTQASSTTASGMFKFGDSVFSTPASKTRPTQAGGLSFGGLSSSTKLGGHHTGVPISRTAQAGELDASLWRVVVEEVSNPKTII